MSLAEKVERLEGAVRAILLHCDIKEHGRVEDYLEDGASLEDVEDKERARLRLNSTRRESLLEAHRELGAILQGEARHEK